MYSEKREKGTQRIFEEIMVQNSPNLIQHVNLHIQETQQIPRRMCGSCVDHKKWWKILKEMGLSDHLICLLRNLCARQEATVRSGHWTVDWFQIRKGVHQGCILSPCLFNLYAEYIMRNARLDEAQAGIKIAGRNINNFRYADDTTLMAEVKRNWRVSWWKWKRRVKKLA